MLMWHGLSDAAILATSSVGYYEGVQKLMGGRAATEDFFRLVSRPGRASLRRRSGPHRFRCAHAAGELGREGTSPGRDDRQPQGERRHRTDAPDLSVSDARPLRRAGRSQAGVELRARPTEALNLKQPLSPLPAGIRLYAARARPALAGYRRGVSLTGRGRTLLTPPPMIATRVIRLPPLSAEPQECAPTRRYRQV